MAADNEMRYRHGSLADESSFMLRSAETEADLWKIQGPGWDTIEVDEAGDWTESELSYLGSRLRTTIPGIRTQKLYSANPAGVGFEYLEANYVAPILRGQHEQDTVWMPEATDSNPIPTPRAFVPSLYSDNTHLDDDYLSNLAQIHDPLKRAALMTGSWDLPADELALFQPGALLAMQEGATGFCDTPIPGHSYVHVWDLARKRDWTVGITLDVTLLPAQIVAYERFRFVPWPEVAARISHRHTTYSAQGCASVTRWDATGLGDPVGAMLDIPLSQSQPFVFTPASKRDAVMALILAAERAALRGPATGHGIESLWAEMSLYRWDDKKLLQDSVMALAIAAHDLKDRVQGYTMARKREEAPVPVRQFVRPGQMAHGWMR